MRKTILIFILVAIFALSACSTAATVPPAEPTAADSTLSQPTELSTSTATFVPTATVEPTTAITPSAPASCQVSPVVPTPDPNEESVLPDVRSTDWTTGPVNAQITIIEYADFQDTNSAKLAAILTELMKTYPQDIRLVFRHFPLKEEYDKDVLAAQAAEAAGIQGKFWQFHTQLFEYQNDWTNLTDEQFIQWAYEKAAVLDMDATKFKNDMLSESVAAKIESARNEIVNIHKVYTNLYDPILFFNGSPVSMVYNLDSLTNVVEYFKLPEKSFDTCPPMTVDPSKTYTATLHTEKGDIVIDLFADKAPWAVNSFVFLAQNGWYDGSAFYRVIPGFLAQTGDPSNSGLGSPGYAFSNEVTPELHFNKAGVVAMANAGYDNTNGSQFFITYAPVPSLDGKYTIFGQVTEESLKVLTTLRPRDPDSDALLLPPDPINQITIEIK